MMDPWHVESLCLIVEIGTAICWVSEDGFEVVMEAIGHLSKVRGFRYRIEPFIAVVILPPLIVNSVAYEQHRCGVAHLCVRELDRRGTIN